MLLLYAHKKKIFPMYTPSAFGSLIAICIISIIIIMKEYRGKETT